MWASKYTVENYIRQVRLFFVGHFLPAISLIVTTTDRPSRDIRIHRYLQQQVRPELLSGGPLLIIPLQLHQSSHASLPNGITLRR